MATEITGVSGVSDAAALQAGGPTGSADMGQDTFLTLLTTQMQHQDPLSPMANEEFLAQLAQFTSLEQLMGLNSTMQGAAMGIASLNNASMASLVGKEVVAMGDAVAYDGEAEEVALWYDAPTSTPADLVIYDEDGDVVFSETVSLEEGENSVVWDGRDRSGARLPEGTYTFELKAQGDEPIEITELIRGTIDSMDYSTGNPLPTVEGVPVALADLIRLTVGEEPEQ